MDIAVEKKTDGLKGASETLLIPLACRARASRENLVSGFKDPKAEEICATLDVDLDRYAGHIPTMRGAVNRGLWFDSRVVAFLKAYPDTQVLSLGSGLNTMYERIRTQTDSGNWRWIDSDLADVVDLRRAVFEDTENRTTIELDASSPVWTQNQALAGEAPLLVISEAVLIYLEETRVASSFKGVAEIGAARPACGFLFDWCAPEFVKRSQRHPAMKNLKDQSVAFHSSMQRASDIQTYHPDWRIVEESSAAMTRSGLAPALFHHVFKLFTGRRIYGLADARLTTTTKA